MSPEKVAGNIFNIGPQEQIPATFGDGKEVVLNNEQVRVEYYDEEDMLQTWDGRKFYVKKGIFPET